MSIRYTLPTSIAENVSLRSAIIRRHDKLPAIRSDSLAAAQFKYPVALVGTTGDGTVTVYYDPSLGQPGLDLANGVFAMVQKTYANCQAYFGVPGKPVNVIVAALNSSTDGMGGASHAGCSFNPGGDLYCDVAFGNPTLTNGLVVAELTECFMGAQAKGWNCGGSTGEALSRFLAELESNGPRGELAGYATAPTWDRAGRQNWIDSTKPTDRDNVSTGCGVLYLYWMMANGHSPSELTKAGCPDKTLASNYKALTGKTTAWSDFSASVSKLGGPISSDDPWH